MFVRCGMVSHLHFVSIALSTIIFIKSPLMLKKAALVGISILLSQPTGKQKLSYHLRADDSRSNHLPDFSLATPKKQLIIPSTYPSLLFQPQGHFPILPITQGQTQNWERGWLRFQLKLISPWQRSAAMASTLTRPTAFLGT